MQDVSITGTSGFTIFAVEHALDRRNVLYYQKIKKKGGGGVECHPPMSPNVCAWPCQLAGQFYVVFACVILTHITTFVI